VYGSFRKDGWEMLVLEDLGPKSVPPWTPRKARSIVHSFAQFHATNKGRLLPTWLKRPAEWFDKDLSWSWTSSRTSAIERAGVAGESAPGAADWYAANGVLLGSVSKRLLEAEHSQLLHADARSDNLRWKDGRLYLVDWPEAIAGPPEFDATAFIQTIAVESTLAPETILEWYQEINPLEPAMVDAAVVAVAGFFADRAWMPELPGLPRLRTFQRRQLVVTLGWALRRLGMETPGWLDAVLAA
jgi:Ser/Thr protein kinase RdoA (MazF antagonist)